MKKFTVLIGCAMIVGACLFTSCDIGGDDENTPPGYSISFTFKGKDYSYQYGLTDTGLDTSPFGDYVPGFSPHYTNMIAAPVLDSSSGWVYAYIFFENDAGTAAGTYSNAGITLNFSAVDSCFSNTNTVYVTSYGSVGEDIVGYFDGNVGCMADGLSHKISGNFRVKRIADDTYTD